MRWVIVGFFTLVLAIAAGSDVKDRRIPNWTVLAVILLFVGWAFVGPSISWTSAFEAAGIAFLLTVVLYLFKFIGAGDSKLFIAVSLFAGIGYLPLFAFATSSIGAAIAIVSLASRPTRALVMFNMRGKGIFGRGIPYGVAIAIAGVLIVFGELRGILQPFETFRHASLPAVTMIPPGS
jgi:prepilin peptidase CpaA